jgi:catabolite regulation protein CreA
MTIGEDALDHAVSCHITGKIRFHHPVPSAMAPRSLFG